MTSPRVLEITGEIQAKLLLIQQIQAEIAALNKEQIQLLAGKERTEQPDFSMFKETTNRLLTKMWKTDDHMLSQEDIRQDVILDYEASDEAVKKVVRRARIEMMKKFFPYGIKNVWGKGYRLTERGTKRRNKPRKQG